MVGGMVYEYQREKRVRGASSAIRLAAHELRREMTPAEKKLWQELRAGKLDNLKFRRQHPIGQFILDFYCPAQHLAVELDGGGRDSERDAARTVHLESYGYRVLRFANAEVLDNLPTVVTTIREVVRSANETVTHSPPLPSLGEGGRGVRAMLTAAALAQIVTARQNNGEKMVFTNGVFDVLHVGHARYLAEARDLGDALIVAVNSDASVRALKGPTRPIVPEDERAELLASLACVDYVVIFGTPTPVPLLELVRPKIYVKGGDYTIDALPETPVVRAYGGEVRILQFVPGRSTTDLISRIHASARE